MRVSLERLKNEYGRGKTDIEWQAVLPGSGGALWLILS